jgi:hypothetical protein
MPRTAAAPAGESDEYSTVTVESHADMWTAKISRTDRSTPGAPGAVSSTLVNVGSISHLLDVTKAERAE